MNKRYPDCQRQDGDCRQCSLTNYGKDCRNRPVHPLAYWRSIRGLTQQALSEKSGVKISTIQKLEIGTNDISGACASTVRDLARALEIQMEELIPY